MPRSAGARRKPATPRASLCALLSVTYLWLPGCATRTASPAAQREPAAAAAEPATPASNPACPLAERDPLAYIRLVTENTRRLEQYTLKLIRQERRGFGPFCRLRDPEEILCWYRRQPFSIRLLWTDPTVKYGESTYVAGEQSDRVRFTPRVGLFGLKPPIVRVGVQVPVIWGETKYPVTDFGIERLMLKTLDCIARAQGRYRIEYLGIEPAPVTSQPAHRLRLTYPADQHEAPVQELFVDAKSDLPVAHYSRFLSGELDAAYFYTELNPDVVLTDDDFLLDAERATLSASGDSPAAAGAAPAGVQ